MKCSILKENLYNGLVVVSSITSKNLTLPILQNVRISVTPGAIEFSTTNLEIGIRYGLRGKVDEPGEITVPARVFLEIVSTLPNERVDCWTEGNNLMIQCAQLNTVLRGISSDEFPVIPTLKDGMEVVCDSKEFADALGQVLFSAATDESRPEIHGVYIHAEDKKLLFASTDSFRLSEREIQTTTTVAQAASRIVPQRTLHELERMITQHPDAPTVRMLIGENQLAFRCGEGEIISRLIEGKYPEYTQVIPTNTKTTLTASTKELIGLVRGASLFCRSGMNDVHCTFSAQKGTVRIQASNTQVGEYDATISAQITGEENEITLNYRFVLDGLNALKSDMVTLKMTEKNNPVVFSGTDAKRKYLHLIMPIKQ